MKRCMMLLLLCAFLLAGCGFKKQETKEIRLPYLTEEERAELEQGLIDSFFLESVDETGTSGLAGYYCTTTELENVSDYQLSDIQVSYTLSGEQVLSLAALPPHTAYRNSAGWYSGSGEEQRAKAEKMEYRYDISYTIGAFNYLIPDCQILPEKETEETEEHEITVDLKTDRGVVTLRIPDLEPVTLEGAVEGVRTGAIRTISEGDNARDRHEFNKKTGCFGGLQLKIIGDKPDENYFIACRLIDDNGIVRGTDYPYFYDDGTANIYLYTPLEPGHYVLECEELRYAWR